MIVELEDKPSLLQEDLAVVVVPGIVVEAVVNLQEDLVVDQLLYYPVARMVTEQAKMVVAAEQVVVGQDP